jgi:GT2 family glycosyltransferase
VRRNTGQHSVTERPLRGKEAGQSSLGVGGDHYQSAAPALLRRCQPIFDLRTIVWSASQWHEKRSVERRFAWALYGNDMSVASFERLGREVEAPPRGIKIEQARVRNQRALRVEPPRPRVHGKFLYVGQEHFWIRGVTYGTFRPDPTGLQFPTKEMVARDFRAIADAGMNSVRVYTSPPRWLLDVAAGCGLRVMIGIPWEQHITFLDDSTRVRRIMDETRVIVRGLARHPAVLCYVVGNEIPPSVVRWYGRSRIERFIKKLYDVVKSEDPSALATYVNFPSTEYLRLPFLDFIAFNVYLESKQSLNSYLARLQNLAGERPLVMGEIGLDSRRNGEAGQAESLDWQIAAAFEAGCAGLFVYAWTDEWFRGGNDIDDWDFGLTTRDRQPKAALRAVSSRFAKVPFAADHPWPKVSVVVCSCNGAQTIAETLAALEKLEYPDYEILVIDDGSTDHTSAIASRHNVRLIRTQNNGLSAARNQGLKAATGEIIAYIDDDAYPDPHWLTYLAASFLRSNPAAVGGPNLAVPGDSAIADCVANAPGGPIHVLLSDEIAEHIPGCNMAFRREKLSAIGGFDSHFRVAGDDVDICWRLQERGWTVGFAPSAVVWHHRRNSIKDYLKQQFGYAKAEALLAEKWPDKYNSAGHVTWRGRLYGRGTVERLFARSRIYHGRWGTAPFQSVYQMSSGDLSSLSLMPEWYFLLALLGFVTTLGLSWAPLLGLTPLLIAGTGLTIVQAIRASGRANFDSKPGSRLGDAGLRVLVAWLHLLQPAARLLGRVQHGMGPWSWKGFNRIVPRLTIVPLWTSRWQPIELRLSAFESILKKAGAPVVLGGDFDDWDLSISGGVFGIVRIIAMVEEHGQGKQLCRFRAWPKASKPVLGIFFSIMTAAALAAVNHAVVAAVLLALMGAIIGLLVYRDCAHAMSQWRDAVKTYLFDDHSLCILAS